MTVGRGSGVVPVCASAGLPAALTKQRVFERYGGHISPETAMFHHNEPGAMIARPLACLARRSGDDQATGWLYLEAASGSIPLFLIVSDARAEARKSIRRLDASGCFEPATTAAANTWISWISAGSLPA